METSLGPIPIKCTASNFISLDDIHPLQGDLKTLDKKQFDKLKTSLLKYGVTFPIFLWKSGDKNYIIDGTQRDRVLHLMRQEGYEIPPLPADFIEAADEREAKEKILLLSSQYGKMSEETLYEFIQASGMDMSELGKTLELPYIDFDRFADGWMKMDFVPDENRDIDEGKLAETDHECPKCGFKW